MINAKNVMTTLFLRIASAISLIFMLEHTAGGLRAWSPMGDHETLKAMTAVRFDAMVANRCYLDLYMGFGGSISIAMPMQTVL